MEITDMGSALNLSILIPVYNWDVRALLHKLHCQAEKLRGECAVEILVMDDGSDEKFCSDALVKHLPMVCYHSFSENRGRVTIRNLLLAQARGDFVLFLDADMLPDTNTFLRNYVEKALTGYDIVCGGISYLQNGEKGRDYAFYLYKSAKTEAIPARERNRTPWRYLFTSNILLRREIAESVRFDPRFTGYGFEDIEWALRLTASYTVAHIDNACTHTGLMTKRQTFVRMRDSIDNYVRLLALHPTRTATSGAAKVTGVLKALPDCILGGMDWLLARLFMLIRWNPLSFFLFQCDKMVLLTRALKDKKKKQC